LASAAILTAGGLVITTIPAYADVTTSTYTIGSPSGGVTVVTVEPSGASVATSTHFEVTFTLPTALSGSGSDWVSVAPSTALASTPSNIDLVDGACLQAGTDGGAYLATGITIDLGSSCNLASGSQAEVDFTAEAPAAVGSFTFAITTSKNSSPGTSNTVTVTTAGPVLTAASYALGANTTYTINNVTVGSLSSSGTSLTLTAAATVGTETIAFVNSGAGGAGYSVSVTPSGGSASADAVTNASAAGATVTLTLGTALTNGDTVTITATGANPAPIPASQSDHITVAPGNGTPETSNAIPFGGSVTSVSVSPSTLVAGAVAAYSVGFKAADATSAGGYIYLTESAGPTNFTSVTGTLVIDTTQNWHFVATGAVYNIGSATIPLQDAVSAGDNISVLVANVTNPPSPGIIGDFTVATAGDPVAVNAPPYTIGANASPGVLVTVSPSTVGAVGSYTISNVHASAALTGGTGTIELEAPAGTVFPDGPGYYQITDSTTSSGSGTVTAALVFSGSNNVTFVVPNTINSGDVLTLNVQDVINPSTASSTDSITLHGNVTGPAPVAVTTTTTTVPTTTTTTGPPVTKATVRDLTTKADVATHKVGKSTFHVVGIKVKCTVEACQGTVTLTDVRSKVGTVKYSERVDKTNTFAIYLNSGGARDLAVAKGHTIKVTATVTVGGGTTVNDKTTLVG
jgi:hypothetical protein